MKYDLEGICQDCMYLEKVKLLFEEKNKEIDRLNDDYRILKELQMKANEEISRLNNIINALKKELTREILDNMPFDISERIQDLFEENK